MIKKIIIGLLVVLVAGGTFFFNQLKDIRTKEVIANFDEQRGLTVLNQMAEAHGIKYWDSIQTYSLMIAQKDVGALAKMTSPYPADKMEFRFDVIPNTFTSRVTFNTSIKNWKDKVWGIQSWHTYSGIKSSPLQLDKENNQDIEFNLPTLQYFFEAPKRIFDADVISYAGERTLDGKIYDLVYATWKSPEPQKNIDQYLLWIDRSTKLLTKMHYTVRDKFNFIDATKNFYTYAKHGNIMFPTKMATTMGPPGNEKITKSLEVLEVKLNDIRKDALLVDVAIGTTGKLSN